MRRFACRLANPKVDLRLAKPDRFQLGMPIGDVDQRDIAKISELQQLVLRQRLLGCQSGPISEPRNPYDDRGGYTGLQKLATADHRLHLDFARTLDAIPNAICDGPLFQIA